jgi:hypothetical protein
VRPLPGNLIARHFVNRDRDRDATRPAPSLARKTVVPVLPRQIQILTVSLVCHHGARRISAKPLCVPTKYVCQQATVNKDSTVFLYDSLVDENLVFVPVTFFFAYSVFSIRAFGTRILAHFLFHRTASSQHNTIDLPPSLNYSNDIVYCTCIPATKKIADTYRRLPLPFHHNQHDKSRYSYHNW